MHHFFCRDIFAKAHFVLGSLALALLPMQYAAAEVTFAGNGTVGGTSFTQTQIDGTFETGGTTGEIIVGISAPFAGGLFIDGTAPVPATLESSSAIVGQNAGSFGAVDLTDLASLWDVTGTLTIGSAGKGTIDLSNASAVRADTAVFGELSSGDGLLRLNGLGSRFIANTLTVGDIGHGRIEASNDSLIYTTDATTIGAASDAGDGRISLTGSGTSWLSEGTLELGGLTGTSHGELHIADLAIAQFDDDVTVNPRGTVNMAGGTLRMRPQVGNPIVNNGLILGDGFIDGGITIGPSGEVRNAGAFVQNGPTVTRHRENLIVAEAVINNGTIQSLGGAMDFEALVTNVPLGIGGGEIIARDAEMHFRAGVSNETGAVITIGGDTTLHGDIVNNGGNIFVLSDSESLMVGDLTFTGSSILGLTAGPAAGTLDVTGAIALDDTIIALDYSAGVFPQAGDTYQILHADGGISGTFGNPASTSGNPAAVGQASAGGILWDIINTGSTLLAQATNAIAVPNGADFNGDGIVDELDLIVWENNFGNTGNPGDLGGIGDADGDGDVDGMDFFLIQRDFGMMAAPPIGALATVPEPSTMVMALLTLVCCPRRRSRG